MLGVALSAMTMLDLPFLIHGRRSGSQRRSGVGRGWGRIKKMIPMGSGFNDCIGVLLRWKESEEHGWMVGILPYPVMRAGHIAS